MVRVKRKSGHVVGDNVVVEDETLTRLERVSEIARMDARGGVHIVGANLDILCIVVTCEPMAPPGFIDRAIVAARASGHTPVLVLNKSDLACFAGYEAMIRPLYKESVDMFSVSAETSDNLTELKTFFSEGIVESLLVLPELARVLFSIRCSLRSNLQQEKLASLRKEDATPPQCQPYTYSMMEENWWTPQDLMILVLLTPRLQSWHTISLDLRKQQRLSVNLGIVNTETNQGVQ